MPDDKFIDTSVLVYAFDKTDNAKHTIAAKLIKAMSNGGEKPVVSVQVLLELYNVLTRFISNPLLPNEALSILNDFFESSDWIKLNYDGSIAKRAIATATDYKMKIWDVLIAETMKENNICTIITENEKDFKKIPGITVVNPFKLER
jgi:predicted nucleic acid-binding protein